MLAPAQILETTDLLETGAGAMGAVSLALALGCVVLGLRIVAG